MVTGDGGLSGAGAGILAVVGVVVGELGAAGGPGVVLVGWAVERVPWRLTRRRQRLAAWCAFLAVTRHTRARRAVGLATAVPVIADASASTETRTNTVFRADRI
jgi:hypothetical protein